MSPFDRDREEIDALNAMSGERFMRAVIGTVTPSPTSLLLKARGVGQLTVRRGGVRVEQRVFALADVPPLL